MSLMIIMISGKKLDKEIKEPTASVVFAIRGNGTQCTRGGTGLRSEGNLLTLTGVRVCGSWQIWYAELTTYFHFSKWKFSLECFFFLSEIRSEVLS